MHYGSAQFAREHTEKCCSCDRWEVYRLMTVDHCWKELACLHVWLIFEMWSNYTTVYIHVQEFANVTHWVLPLLAMLVVASEIHLLGERERLSPQTLQPLPPTEVRTRCCKNCQNSSCVGKCPCVNGQSLQDCSKEGHGSGILLITWTKISRTAGSWWSEL